MWDHVFEADDGCIRLAVDEGPIFTAHCYGSQNSHLKIQIYVKLAIHMTRIIHLSMMEDNKNLGIESYSNEDPPLKSKLGCQTGLLLQERLHDIDLSKESLSTETDMDQRKLMRLNELTKDFILDIERDTDSEGSSIESLEALLAEDKETLDTG
ncbi:hypothetical protein Tco_0378404 [Tanacetum coccineum]